MIGIYELSTLQYIGYGMVDQIEDVRNETTIQQAAYDVKFVVNYTDLVKAYYVKFKNKLNANITGYWSLVEVDLNNGSLIENNIFYNGYVSMTKLKSDQGVIRNNSVYLLEIQTLLVVRCDMN